MKFRFCGDGDCPDWVLSEIHSTLSILSAIKLRMLAQAVAKSIYEDKITNEEKLKDMFSSVDDNGKSLKSAIACIRFILVNSAIYTTDETVLDTELQQLGLPKEHSGVLCRAHTEHISHIQNKNLSQKLSVNPLESVECKISEDAIECGVLELKIRGELCEGKPKDTIHKIHIHKADLSVLLNNLREVKTVMEKYDIEKKDIELT